MADYTGFPEMMDGRVKTLHPKIHGGILGRRGQDDAVMAEHGIQPIDMVVVNLYPFEATVAKPDCTLEDAIENIDIGGPTMVRAAAKNHRVRQLSWSTPRITPPCSRSCAPTMARPPAPRASTWRSRPIEHTAAYDGAIANYFGTPGARRLRPSFPRTFNTQFHKAQEMRYGENPHQQAAFYRGSASRRGRHRHRQAAAGQGAVLQQRRRYRCRAGVRQELRRARLRHRQARQPLRCGGGGRHRSQAYELAFATDPESAFGGIIAFNRELDGATAQAIVERQFVEVIIAPGVSAEAVAAVAAKKNVRLLVCGEWSADRRPRWITSGSTAACWCRTATSAWSARPTCKVVSKRAAQRAANAGPAVRLEGRQVRQVQRHRLRRQRARPSASAPAR